MASDRRKKVIEMAMTEENYQELVRKLRKTQDYLKKMERKILNEPESALKYEKLELMQLVLNRISDIVNWWNKVEYKEQKKEKRQKEIERAEWKKQNKIKAAKQFEEDAKPYVQEWNTRCRYYNQDGCGNRSCSIGMDMTFCSKKCAYATNVTGSTRIRK